jgi:hypothetical protein
MIITIIVSAAVAFVGFSGTDKLATLLAGWHQFAPNTINLLYNAVVLAILLVTILGLVYRFDERAGRHRNAVEKLTAFIRDAEDHLALSGAGIVRLGVRDLDVYREKYKGISEGLPPTTDRQFTKAKGDLVRKSGTAKADQRLRWVAEDRGAESSLTQCLADLLDTPARRAVLNGVRKTLGTAAWVTGGFVRDPVWDALHEYPISTPPDDIDVVYFDSDTFSKADDEDLERRLSKLSQNIRWSVKNQARMHLAARDAPYRSLRDAISHAPETATAIAVRLDEDGVLHVIAPHGLGDLFMGNVRPTPNFDQTRYLARVTAKNWVARWPKVHVWHAHNSANSAKVIYPSASRSRRWFHGLGPRRTPGRLRRLARKLLRRLEID